MLRQVFILNRDELIYQRIFANALDPEEVQNLRFKIKQKAMGELGKTIGYFDYYKFRVVYEVEMEFDIIFIFITGLMDDFFRLIRPIMISFKEKFLELFTEDFKKKKFDSEKIKDVDSIIDLLHSEIKPKISVVGFSGVGKTTIKNLIKKGEVPLHHVPTISGDIASIKIDNLEFSLFDFAGQEQFKYLWKGFIKGSNAVLVITDSTPINVEKSRFFIDLRNKEAPYACIAVIGNKQDLSNAMKVENIENILGLKTYSMIANRSENREKMIQIIADVLDVNIDSSPLIKRKIEQKEIKKLEKKERKIEVIETQIKENFQNVNIDPDLCSEVINDIKGVQVENILRNHLNMISATLKALNNNNELIFEEFYKFYQEFTNNEFICKNIALKQFLETQFSLLRKSIEEDEFVATKLKDDKDVIINALLLAYLSEANPHKFPIFESLLKKFEFNGFDAQTIKDIHVYFIRIVNKIRK
ncbi:MAG: ADP-ribosylation factor-like protein [Promethearchaeota archaeon]